MKQPELRIKLLQNIQNGPTMILKLVVSHLQFQALVPNPKLAILGSHPSLHILVANLKLVVPSIHLRLQSLVVKRLIHLRKT